MRGDLAGSSVYQPFAVFGSLASGLAAADGAVVR